MSTLVLVNSTEKHLVLIPNIFQLISLEAENGNMCSQNKEDLAKQILNGNSILAFWDSKWIGYCYLQVWENYSEICGSVVVPSFRKRGFGTKLKKACLELALAKYPEKDVITLSHDASLRVSLKLGFKIQDKRKFHPELWEMCPQCTSFGKFPDCQCVGLIYKGE